MKKDIKKFLTESWNLIYGRYKKLVPEPVRVKVSRATGARQFIIIIFALVGLATIGFSRASLPHFSFESEESSTTQNVAAISDQSASAGGFIRFGQASQASVWLTPTGGNVSQNSNLTVRVMIDTFANDHETAQVRLVFDPTKFKYVSQNGTSSNYNTAAINDTGTGYVEIVRGNTSPLSGKNIFVDVTFQALAGSGSGTINFDNSNTVVAYAGNALSRSTAGAAFNLTP